MAEAVGKEKCKREKGEGRLEKQRALFEKQVKSNCVLNIKLELKKIKKRKEY